MLLNLTLCITNYYTNHPFLCSYTVIQNIKTRVYKTKVDSRRTLRHCIFAAAEKYATTLTTMSLLPCLY